jgi:hypothetical protein
MSGLSQHFLAYEGLQPIRGATMAKEEKRTFTGYVMTWSRSVGTKLEERVMRMTTQPHRRVQFLAALTLAAVVLSSAIAAANLAPPASHARSAGMSSAATGDSLSRAGQGRCVVAPDRPSSLNIGLHPAFFKAASCRAGVWSSVDTRA